MVCVCVSDCVCVCMCGYVSACARTRQWPAARKNPSRCAECVHDSSQTMTRTRDEPAHPRSLSRSHIHPPPSTHSPTHPPCPPYNTPTTQCLDATVSRIGNGEFSVGMVRCRRGRFWRNCVRLCLCATRPPPHAPPPLHPPPPSCPSCSSSSPPLARPSASSVCVQPFAVLPLASMPT